MHLKRLRRGAQPACDAQSLPMHQAAAASDLLRELESLTEQPEAAGEPIDDIAYQGYSTPAIDVKDNLSTRTVGDGNTCKRRRKTQLVSVLGSQEVYFSSQQQQEHMEHSHVEQDDVEVDLQTPPWLQQSEPKLNSSKISARKQPHQAVAFAVQGRAGVSVRAASSPPDRAVDCHEQSNLHARHMHCFQPQQQQRSFMQHTGQQAEAQQLVSEDEDAICDDSGDDLVPTAPSSRHVGTQRRLGACQPAAITPPGASQHQGLQPNQQQQLHTALQLQARALGVGRSTPQQGQQSRQRTCAQHTVKQLPQHSGCNGLPNAEAADEQDDWMPPKYCNREQHQLQHTQPPLGARRSAGVPAAAALTAARTPTTAAGPGRPHPGVAEVPGVKDPPWWLILEDFVPVEVLMHEAMNPRDGAIVHINYKSQFKDGVTPAKRGSTAAGTTAASRKRKGAGNTRARPAAATGTGGFCAAGEVAAAAAETKGRGKRGRSGKAASGGKGRASKAKGSGGRRKRAGSGGGKWRYRNGRKVFIDTSGKQLTGSAAWGRYQQSRGG